MAVGFAVLMMAGPTLDFAKPPPPDPIARERALVGVAPAPCRGVSETEIVVCGRRGSSPRIPLPDDRYADGEVVFHPGEPPTQTPYPEGHSCARPGACDPPRLGETIGKIINWLGGN